MGQQFNCNYRETKSVISLQITKIDLVVKEILEIARYTFSAADIILFAKVSLDTALNAERKYFHYNCFMFASHVPFFKSKTTKSVQIENLKKQINKNKIIQNKTKTKTRLKCMNHS